MHLTAFGICHKPFSDRAQLLSVRLNKLTKTTYYAVSKNSGLAQSMHGLLRLVAHTEATPRADT